MYVCIYVCTCICTYICICICDSLWAVCSRERFLYLPSSFFVFGVRFFRCDEVKIEFLSIHWIWISLFACPLFKTSLLYCLTPFPFPFCSPFHSFIHWLIDWFIHSLIHWFIDSFIHSTNTLQTNKRTTLSPYSTDNNLCFRLVFVYWCRIHSFSASSWSTVPNRIWYGRNSNRGPTSVNATVLWSSFKYVWCRKEMKSLHSEPRINPTFDWRTWGFACCRDAARGRDASRYWWLARPAWMWGCWRSNGDTPRSSFPRSRCHGASPCWWCWNKRWDRTVNDSQLRRLAHHGAHLRLRCPWSCWHDMLSLTRREASRIGELRPTWKLLG